MNEITRIAQQTTYGGKLILDGGEGTPDKTMFKGTGCEGQMVLQVGANSGDTINFDVANFKFDKLASAAKVTQGAFNAGNLILSTAEGASKVISAMDAMIKQVDSQRADLGAIQNRSTRATSLLTSLTLAPVSATLTSPRSPLTCRNRASSSRLLPLCSCRLTLVHSWLCPY